MVCGLRESLPLCPLTAEKEKDEELERSTEESPQTSNSAGRRTRTFVIGND